ncbi:uncharacterized protein LOC119180076 isoform X2 [Rhipicephalus microplus]|uniref:uncharacterized protein LOC119180076 isoform X2 n=1 Tax=Rhipicephalus microplus TaxID=6941 RepID=UPI003F6ACAFB
MNLLISILLTTCTVNAMTEACADSQNKEPRFCWGKQLLSQKYCKNVKDLHRWTCIGGSSLGCACKTKFRADDGSCVEERECEKLDCIIWGTRSGETIEVSDCYKGSSLAYGKLDMAVKN